MHTTNNNQIRPIYSIGLTRKDMTDDTETTGGFSHTSNSITNEPDIVRQNTLYITIPILKPKDPVKEDSSEVSQCWVCTIAILIIIPIVVILAATIPP
ncbi:hypothetical protein CHUAL_012156 [Chamberlinius hualienensis]